MTLRIGIGSPPVGAADSGSRAIINLLKGDPWLTNRSDGRPGDRIVTSWAWDDSNTVLTLKLRRDVYFHDDTLLTPKLAAEVLRTTSVDQPSFRSVASIEPAGEDTVVIRLKERSSFVLPDLTSMLVVKPENRDIGTGPYRIVSRQNSDAQLTAFERYYRGRPSLAGMDVITYPTQRKAWAGMMRGNVDMLYEVSRESAEFVEAETSVNTFSFTRPYYIHLTFNVRRPVLSDPRVRRAINVALDRAALVRDGLRGRGFPADGPLLPQYWAYSPPAQPLTHNPAEARRLLDEAGYPPKPDGVTAVRTRLQFKCLVLDDDPRFDRIALLVQKQLVDVGIDMQLVPVPAAQMVALAGAGDFDALLMEMTGRSLSRVYEFLRSNEGRFIKSGYMAADTVLDRIRSSVTEEEVRAGVVELGRVLYDDPPAAFLAWEQRSRAVLSTFDVVPEEKRDIMTNLWLWRPAAAPRQARQ